MVRLYMHLLSTDRQDAFCVQYIQQKVTGPILF